MIWFFFGCTLQPSSAVEMDGVTPWSWELPDHFPAPPVPDDNPMSVEKVDLGRHLFYDERLSLDGSFSCASCHRQELAFTDGRGRSVGVTGEAHPRGALSLANVGYMSRLTWANPLFSRLNHQAMIPMFGEEPVEMGLSGREKELLTALAADSETLVRFEEAFPASESAISIENITKAIASFQRTLISANSPYDKHLQGDASALSPNAKRGMALFFSERLGCVQCHAGFNFSDTLDHEGLAVSAFHNTGLYNIGGAGAFPKDNTGVFEITGKPEDMGRFRAPSLRNIAITAPYMHDGSIETLADVLEHYAAGGRTIDEGPHAGDGSAHPNKSELITGFFLTGEEKRDIMAFLGGLTDEGFLKDAQFSKP